MRSSVFNNFNPAPENGTGLNLVEMGGIEPPSTAVIMEILRV